MMDWASPAIPVVGLQPRPCFPDGSSPWNCSRFSLNQARNWLIRAPCRRNFRAATLVVSPPAKVQAMTLWCRDGDHNQSAQSIRAAAVSAGPAVRSSTRTSLLTTTPHPTTWPSQMLNKKMPPAAPQDGPASGP